MTSRRGHGTLYLSLRTVMCTYAVQTRRTARFAVNNHISTRSTGVFSREQLCPWPRWHSGEVVYLRPVTDLLQLNLLGLSAVVLKRRLLLTETYLFYTTCMFCRKGLPVHVSRSKLFSSVRDSPGMLYHQIAVMNSPRQILQNRNQQTSLRCELRQVHVTSETAFSAVSRRQYVVRKTALLLKLRFVHA